MAGQRKYPIVDGKKKCVACKRELPFTSEYYVKDASAPGGLTARCKQCRYVQKRKWETENPEKNKAAQRAYYAKTRDTYLPRKQKWRSENRDKDRASARQWAKENPEKREKYRSEWLSIPRNRVATTLRARVRRCISEGRPIYRDMENILGYSIEDLIRHIEGTFTDGMSWENYTYRGWHIDHIRPVSSFSLVKSDGSLDLNQVRECWALKNLRALWGKENMIKSDKPIKTTPLCVIKKKLVKRND